MVVAVRDIVPRDLAAICRAIGVQVATAACLVAGSFAAWAADPEHDCRVYADASPALLVSGQETVAAEFLHPYLEPGRNVISYGGYVGIDGHITGVIATMSSNSFRGVLKRLANDLSQLRFEPAALNSKPLKVYVTLMIIADQREDGSVGIVMFNNHGPMFAGFQVSEISPQRVGEFGHQGIVFNAMALAGTVDRHGQMRDDVKVLKEIDVFTPKINKMLRYLRESCYLPGRRNGEPEKMVYYEWFERCC